MICVTRCNQCGFAYEEVAPTDVAGRLRAAPERYRQAISNSLPEVIRTRPDTPVWSALEYACHVRDVLLTQRDRAVLLEGAAGSAPAPSGSRARCSAAELHAVD